LSNRRPIICPACGFSAGRPRNFQSYAIAALYGLSVAFPLWSASENYLSWPAAIALAILMLALLTFADAATIQLVAAAPRKMRLRTIVLVVVAWVLFPVIAFPLTAYVIGVRDSDCRDWGQTLRRGRSQLKACDDPKQRYYILGETAKAAAQLRSYKDAELYATELLRLAPAYRKDWNYGNAIHDGHMVLGRIALVNGDRATARRELLLAGASPGSPQLNSFGPNMSLARDLLRTGDRQAVFQYFDECEKFWKFGHGRIARWKILARFHLPPDFGANVLF
jgi:hypothetical protein